MIAAISFSRSSVLILSGGVWLIISIASFDLMLMIVKNSGW
jgi:hypothetical protein